MVLGEIGRAVVVGRVVGKAVAGEGGTPQDCLVPDNLLEKMALYGIWSCIYNTNQASQTFKTVLLLYSFFLFSAGHENITLT